MTTKATSAIKPDRRSRWLLARWLGSVAALLSTTATTQAAVAQRTDYRAATAVPATWQDYAKRLQQRIQDRLAGDDDAARSFQVHLENRSQAAGSISVVARIWTMSGGGIERIEFDGLEGEAAVYLRALLLRVDIGPPPRDMLQPLRLRLSLRPRELDTDTK